MKNKLLFRRGLCLILCVCALLSLCVCADAATLRLTRARVYFDGLYTANGFISGDLGYVALEDICAYCGVYPVSSYSKDGRMIASCGDGFFLHEKLGSGYIMVNNRYVYDPWGSFFYKGKLYYTTDVIAHIFSLTDEFDPASGRIDFGSGDMEIISGGMDYYEKKLGENDFFWLCRVINSEAGIEPFDGKIAVGNVVMNRVRNSHFPESVYDVVFELKGAVQFQVTMNGTIYADPSEASVAAAALCVEGCDVAGNCLYFLNPGVADNTWFRTACTYEMTIGGHEFYS